MFATTDAKPRRWSKRAVLEAHRRYKQGEPKNDIAASMGVSWAHLYRAMRRIGLSTREFSVAARRYDDIGRRAYSLRMQGKMFKEENKYPIKSLQKAIKL